MVSLFQYVAPPGPCGYLPEQTWQLEYEFVAEMSPEDYHKRLLQGWRRFGHSIFRPRCPSCTACRSLRVVVDRFRPNRSQRRVQKLNEGSIRLRIGKPSVTAAKLALYDRFHAYQTESKGWPGHEPKDGASYAESFVTNPFGTEEWCFFLNRSLVGVGYVDPVPDGLSAIYFFYDPDLRHLSLGTWNVLSLLKVAAARGLSFVYLGYFVAGCGSLEYKGNFAPNQTLGLDGTWHDFRS